MEKKPSEPLTEAARNHIESFIREQLHEEMESIINMVKMHRKMQENTIEGLSSAINLMEKQFNMKIGGIQGNIRKKGREDDILATFNTPEELYDYIQRQRQPKLIDNKSKTFDPTTEFSVESSVNP